MPIQQQYPLPENRNPRGTRCLMIDIPDDDEYERLFISAIVRLTWWFMYDRDNTHFGQVVAGLWKAAIKTIRDCQSQEVHTYEDYEAMPRFRDHCNHELFYVGCDDTEHQVAFLSDIPAGGSAGTGSPQPSPGGGQQNYCQTLNANQQMFIPTLINSGDTIELVSAKGSWWDGGEQSLGFPIWRCPDGEQFVAGVCTGPTTETITGTDPVVGAAHMSLIVYIGATAYSLESGTVTVPGGITNGNAVVQVNDTAIANNQGSADVCIKVTNNKATTWTHIFDFTLAPGPFSLVAMEGGQWIAGVGWSSTYVSPYQQIQVRLVLPSATYLGMSMDFDSTVSGVNSFIGIVSSTTVSGTPSIGHNHLDYAGSLVTGNNIFLQVNGGSGVVGTDGQYVITRFTISGAGTDPF